MSTTERLDRIEAMLAKTLTEHEALRATNRELGAKNRALGQDNASLRRRLTNLSKRLYTEAPK